MELQVFSIEFDNSTRTYYAGQYITGKIVISHDSEISTRGIALRFSGTASVSWTESVEEGSGDSLRSVVKQHANKEVYMDEDAFGRAGEPQDLVIPQGRNEYPFTYQLPPNVPSTFKYDQGQIHGEITYNLEVKIKWKSTRKTDHKTNSEFYVNAVMNVNRYSQATQPVVVFKEKHLCCFCCKDGPVTVNVKMPKTGYFPGDNMTFTVDIANFSSKRISSIEAVIEQETRFVSTATNNEKVLHEIVMKVPPGPSVDSRTKELWKGEIVTPEVLPTNLGGCHIILRSYSLKINVNITLSRGLKAIVPIVIGSAPRKIGSTSEENMKSARSSPTANYNQPYMPPDYKDIMNL